MNSEDERSSFPPIPPGDTKIWRYIDFTQLYSILAREALWFNRTDLYDDPLEGSHSRRTIKDRKDKHRELVEINGRSAEEIAQTQLKTAKICRKTSYLNCWHKNERESMAMWEIYSTKNQGVAIQTRIRKLKKALRAKDGYINQGDTSVPYGTSVPEDTPSEKIFTLGSVQYIDYDKHYTPVNNIYGPLFYKRLSYKHEQEFRIAISKFFDLAYDKGIDGVKIGNLELEYGKYMELDLDELIEKIHVMPSSPNWFLELVRKLVEQFGFESNLVKRSSLEEDPVF